MRQYWSGKTKPKPALKLTRNAFSKLLWNLEKNDLPGFSSDHKSVGVAHENHHPKISLAFPRQQ